jgi:hypothetical protein
MTSLDTALRQFEATEANLAKLDALWAEIHALIPEGIHYGAPLKYDELCWAFRQILPAVPAIDGARLPDALHGFDEIAQMRLDATELGILDAQMTVENEIETQGRALQEYRLKFLAKRRALVRDRVLELVDLVDGYLSTLLKTSVGRPANDDVNHATWADLKQAVKEIDTLLGSTQRPTRWRDLQRHLHYGAQQDLQDIHRMDWPDVKGGIVHGLYGQHDPLPVDVADLGEVVASKPKGRVAVGLGWSSLTDEDFERLLFVLISETPGYENAQWLQRTNAADRGRDLSVTRVEDDPLMGVTRRRTIIQCKHWLAKSVSLPDASSLMAQMTLWEPPRVDCLIIATSGRFTMDAVDFIEKHNGSDSALQVVMWPESHLERLLAARPHLIAEFGLRAPSK